MAFVIRPAGPDDAGSIHGFITGLAVYERAPEAVEVTPAELRQQLASPTPPFECLLAFDDERPVGMALFFPTYSTWRGRAGVHLEDLFVPEVERRRGIGTALLQHLAALAVARGCARLEWAVLDWNEPALRFYRGLGAEPLDEWTTHRLSGAALAALAQTRGGSDSRPKLR